MAGDGPPRCRLPGLRRRALPADPLPARARPSVLWRAQYWLCIWRWRVARSGGCGGTLLADVEEEAPDKLVGRERHRAKPPPAVAAGNPFLETSRPARPGEQAGGFGCGA